MDRDNRQNIGLYCVIPELIIEQTSFVQYIHFISPYCWMVKNLLHPLHNLKNSFINQSSFISCISSNIICKSIFANQKYICLIDNQLYPHNL